MAYEDYDRRFTKIARVYEDLREFYEGYESLGEFGGLQDLSELRGFSMGYESFRRVWRLRWLREFTRVYESLEDYMS